MSDIALINDSQQSAIVTNGIGKNGEIYMKAAGSTDAGALVVYDAGNWRKFAHEAINPWNGNTYAIELDGTNDYIDISGASSLVSSVTAFSVSFWYKQDAYGGVLIGSGTSNNDGFWVQAYSNGQFYLIVRNTGTTTLSTSVPALDTWVHVVATYNAGNINLYLTPAGGSTSTTTITGGPASTSSTAGNNLSIGRLPWNNNPFYLNGKIDEVALFSSELSSSNVTTLYNSGVPGDISSLSPVNWWRMGENDGGTGTTITDQGSGSNDGTLTNGPTFSSDVPS